MKSDRTSPSHRARTSYFLIALVGLLLGSFFSGCVHFKAAMVEPRSQMLYVSVRTTYKGIVLGMCGPQSTAYVTRRFRLVPGKTKYAASEVTRVDEDDKPETPDFDFGYILLNEKDRTVEIRLKYHGKDLDENGVYPMRPLIN